jgi:histidyl-tRNA synthetase
MNLFRLLESYQIDEWVEFDASIVRGLAYYTGPVFEAHDRKGELRAICGGGRYNRLLSSLGGNDLPASGFGFGDMVIMELLNDLELLPDISSGSQDVVVSLGEELRPAAMAVASKLREGGRTVDIILDNKKLKWAFRHADRIGASRLVMIMPDEWREGKIRIKNLESGEENDFTINDL